MLEGAEDAADPKPVARRADEVVVVTRAENAREEREADDDVQPLLDDLPVDTGEPNQEVRKNAAHDELPDALDPEVNDPPAPERIVRLVIRRNHPRQVQDRGHQEAEEEHDRGRGHPRCLPNRHADVGDEQKDVDHDEVVERARNLEELAPLPPVEVETDDRRHSNDDQRDELHVRELGPVERPLAFIRNDEVCGPHEARQQPHHEQVVV
jgi:hypothetical protein